MCSNLKLSQDPLICSSCPSDGQFLCKRPYKGLMSRRGRAWKLTKEKVRIWRLKKKEMEMKNMKLYLANKIIVDENERLKKKATALLHENHFLLSQLQKPSSLHTNCSSNF
ncbi:hypothetical protein M9H77_33348 [Catharanthus roseus]|uniref:Uncharacterized protein n=1 Tax=Catharanthus roseus TaxID=4058 RepID=A0ACB9ZIL3_CATRO|nr:hypothetical protein M9H77_33348 [Catharanthus roseus]